MLMALNSLSGDSEVSRLLEPLKLTCSSYDRERPFRCDNGFASGREGSSELSLLLTKIYMAMWPGNQKGTMLMIEIITYRFPVERLHYGRKM
jgi:hypothetical protein